MQRGSLEEIRQCNTSRFKSDAPFVSRLIIRLPPRFPPPWSIEDKFRGVLRSGIRGRVECAKSSCSALP